MFFSLSVAMGINITFGSYLDKQKNLQKNATIVPLFDTIFAIMAGMMIMPACAAFGVDYNSGPGLLFASMQKVFLDGMGGTAGNVLGFLFYFLVFIAAITSSIALLEVCTACIVDRQLDKGQEPQRKKITLIFAVLIFIIAIPVALDALGSGGATIKAPFELLGLTPDSSGYAMWNDCWLDFYDMITEGILMPLGALFMSLILGWALPNLVKTNARRVATPSRATPTSNSVSASPSLWSWSSCCGPRSNPSSSNQSNTAKGPDALASGPFPRFFS